MPAYHSVSGSAAEDLFIELFSETFGAEKTKYLYSQYHFYDIYQNSRYADFMLESGVHRIAEPVLPPDVGQFEVFNRRLFEARQDRPIAPGIFLFRQFAPSGGCGDLFQAHLIGQRHLGLPAAPEDAEQLVAIHQARDFRGGRIEQLGAERTEEGFLNLCVAADDIEGVAALGHGALPEHFTGDKE